MKLINNILLGSLILSLSACSTDDTVEPSVKDIRFEQEASAVIQTKGSAITGNKLTAANGDFGLFAYKLPSSGAPVYETGFFNNVKARVNAQGKIEYDGGTQYWPKADDLRFLAYYPYAITGGGVSINQTPADKSSAQMTFTYAAAPGASGHQDLMYAVSDPTREQLVKLKFEHALTRLTFQINKTIYLTETATIQKIEIKNIKNTGTLTVPATTVQWTESGAADKTYSASYNNVSVLAAEHTDGQYLLQKDNGGDSFMVLPMKTFADNAVLEITYTVGAKSGQVYRISLNKITNTAHKWEMGKHMNYKLTMDKEDTEIVFDSQVEVTPWVKEDIVLPWQS